MIHPADLPETLPLFPLSGAVLLPRARLPLHVFEPRYLAMIEDCLKSERRLIGMIQPRGEGDTPQLVRVGCAGRLTSFSELEDGRYMVTLTGVARFALADEVPGFVPYRRARVDYAPYLADLNPPAPDPGFDRPTLHQGPCALSQGPQDGHRLVEPQGRRRRDAGQCPVHAVPL